MDVRAAVAFFSIFLYHRCIVILAIASPDTGHRAWRSADSNPPRSPRRLLKDVSAFVRKQEQNP